MTVVIDVHNDSQHRQLHRRKAAAAARKKDNKDPREAGRVLTPAELAVGKTAAPSRKDNDPVQPGTSNNNPILSPSQLGYSGGFSGLFGGNITQCVTGAAPINPDILRFFDAAGVLVLEGYGMTETSTAATISLRSLAILSGPQLRSANHSSRWCASTGLHSGNFATISLMPVRTSSTTPRSSRASIGRSPI